MNALPKIEFDRLINHPTLSKKYIIEKNETKQLVYYLASVWEF